MWSLFRKDRDRAPRVVPAVPDGVRVYAIGDIHGRLDLLERLFAQIEADLAATPVAHSAIVFLGDYVDRGPQSRGVIDAVLGCRLGTERICLRGNHESFLLLALDEAASFETWRRYGGVETLHSYGVPVVGVLRGAGFDDAREALRAQLPSAHLTFLEELRSSWSIGDYFFCHAGVRPGVPLDRQSDQDLLWIREEFLRFPDTFGKIVVHGHTAAEKVDERPNRIGIDTGAYASGRLTCLVLEGTSRRIIQT